MYITADTGPLMRCPLNCVCSINVLGASVVRRAEAPMILIYLTDKTPCGDIQNGREYQVSSHPIQ